MSLTPLRTAHYFRECRTKHLLSCRKGEWLREHHNQNLSWGCCLSLPNHKDSPCYGSIFGSMYTLGPFVVKKMGYKWIRIFGSPWILTTYTVNIWNFFSGSVSLLKKKKIITSFAFSEGPFEKLPTAISAATVTSRHFQYFTRASLDLTLVTSAIYINLSWEKCLGMHFFSFY